jgi:hypothetical protein
VSEDSFEKEVARAISPALFEYRLKQLEDGHQKIERRMETLATKQDVKDIKDQIATAAEHRFEWWKIVAAGFLSAFLVFGLTLAANAISSHH